MIKEEALKIAKPILFNTEMVRAIQNGMKTVTRRVVKLRYRENERGFFTAVIAGCLYLCYSDEEDKESRRVKVPYQVGDLLYVRETWAAWSRTEGIPPKLHYKADGEDLPCVKWRPSIHMPREAARIFLRVTSVCVERLQDIMTGKMDEMLCEGIYQDPKFDDWFTWGDGCHNSSPIDCFKRLWNGTVKKSDIDKYGWAANPWVWVIEFERLEVTE